ncbi:MAG TPA: MarR family transcriptional regulator [Polyangiaceae bacterium]|nr:MarR family transcriptional regulator [Polyangiaceae bacterium]
MTPARMDILRAISDRFRRRQRPTWQSTLRRVVGYTARSTISELLKEIEALGWIRRRPSTHDKRQVEVRLTKIGRHELDRAHGRFFSGWSLTALKDALGWAPPSDQETAAWDAYERMLIPLDEILTHIRFALRDMGSLFEDFFDD